MQHTKDRSFYIRQTAIREKYKKKQEKPMNFIQEKFDAITLNVDTYQENKIDPKKEKPIEVLSLDEQFEIFKDLLINIELTNHDKEVSYVSSNKLTDIKIHDNGTIYYVLNDPERLKNFKEKDIFFENHMPDALYPVAEEIFENIIQELLKNSDNELINKKVFFHLSLINPLITRNLFKKIHFLKEPRFQHETVLQKCLHEYLIEKCKNSKNFTRFFFNSATAKYAERMLEKAKPNDKEIINATLFKSKKRKCVVDLEAINTIAVVENFEDERGDDDIKSKLRAEKFEELKEGLEKNLFTPERVIIKAIECCNCQSASKIDPLSASKIDPPSQLN